MPAEQSQPRRSLGTFPSPSCVNVVSRAQSVLGDYLDPRTKMTDRECIDRLLAVLDGPVTDEVKEDAAAEEFAQNLIDEASMDSFPCSDPPAWISRRS